MTTHVPERLPPTNGMMSVLMSPLGSDIAERAISAQHNLVEQMTKLDLTKDKPPAGKLHPLVQAIWATKLNRDECLKDVWRAQNEIEDEKTAFDFESKVKTRLYHYDKLLVEQIRRADNARVDAANDVISVRLRMAKAMGPGQDTTADPAALLKLFQKFADLDLIPRENIVKIEEILFGDADVVTVEEAE